MNMVYCKEWHSWHLASWTSITAALHHHRQGTMWCHVSEERMVRDALICHHCPTHSRRQCSWAIQTILWVICSRRHTWHAITTTVAHVLAINTSPLRRWDRSVSISPSRHPYISQLTWPLAMCRGALLPTRKENAPTLIYYDMPEWRPLKHC